MSKEKELKAMVKIFENAECSHLCHKCKFEQKHNACLRYYAMAELQKAGYGDIKQAVREFAERLKEVFETQYWGSTQKAVIKEINKLVAEVTGE